MRVKIDINLCTGCGLCRDLCPEVFAMESFLAVPLANEVPALVEAACRKAAARCPLAAIVLLN